jgi:peptidoglycan/xylan/chitin deacetylase (PgdA/CDA1 family)
MIETLKKNKKIWDLFTCSEEYNANTLDKHNRFLYKFSKREEILKPKTSEFLIKKRFKFKLPNDYKFAVCITHDIDHIYPSLKYKGYTSLKLASKGKIKQSFNRFLNKKNPYWNFNDIIKLEKKYDAKSSFFIMADNSNYNPSEIKEELQNLIEDGYEVGLHGGYDSYNNLDLLKKEKEKLENIIEKKISGYRSHYLRFKTPDTWNLLKKTGFKYDTTFGYADYVGFRNGMCHPFKPYDLNENKQIDFLEIPLTIMDGTLNQYMNLNTQDSWDVCKKTIDNAKDLAGVITLLWHNTYFDDVYYKGWRKLYEKILAYCHQEKAWLTSCNNLYDWWMKKGW